MSSVHHGRGSVAKGMHFYQTIQLRQLQDQELMLPRNFVEKYWKGVSNPISLKFPNGSECKMNWVQRGDDVWLLNWMRFARSLRCGDLLVFQYNGGSDFHVIILDDSKLEIDYSNMKCNDDQDSNKICKQEEESDDDDCVEILNDIAATPQGTNIYKRKFNINATQKKVSGKFIYLLFVFIYR
ncbi:putative transcription factor B3-Domain family [Medicago truncatula]|uniref:B3 DNA-binding domain protein n=1 Tax=Medicago truncatula TaxID=3880 RepID=A0A072VH89_MEDTR|nr:B3 DNA-binding domain protein [Medicago truncatula]RHN78215.1 putative transcription factor B3-Domain family [Medicago truncatula]